MRPQNSLEWNVATAHGGGKFDRLKARAIPDERTVTQDLRGQMGHNTPMTQTMVRVATLVGGLCFLQNHPKTAHKNLCLMAQGVMDFFPGEPLTVLVGNFGHRAVHVPKHTVFSLALRSPTHILTLGVLACGDAAAKERGGNKNNSSTATEEYARREEPAKDEGRFNFSTTKECT